MATITSNGTGGGDWHDTSSWDGGVIPASTDKVIIDDDDIIVLDGVCECGNGAYPSDSSPYDNAGWSLQLKGTLKASHTVNSELKVDGLINYYRSSGSGHSTLDFEDIPETINFTWHLNPKGSMTSSGYYYACSLYANSSSRTPKVKISSAYHRKRNTFIIGEVAAGATTFTVDDATGWKAGDELLIAPRFTGTTQWNTNHDYDEVIIQSVSGNDITITTGLTYDHGYSDNNDHPAAGISNKTSNVKIMGYNDSTYCPSIYILRADFKMKDVVGDYLNNCYSLNSNIFRIAHMGIYSTLDTTFESCFFQANGTNLNHHLYGMLYTNSTYDTYSVVEIKDIAVNYKPRSNRAAYYGIDSYYTGRIVKIIDCNVYCSQRYHNAAQFNDYQQPAKYINCKSFNSNQAFNLHDNAITSATGCWSIGSYYGTSSYNSTAKFINHHFRFVRRLGYGYANWIGFAKYNRADFDDVHIEHTDIQEYFYRTTNPAGCEWLFTDIQGNTAKQIIFYTYGSFLRDTSIYDTSVASIKAKPRDANNALAFIVDKYVNSGQTLTISIRMRKDSDYNGTSRPLVRLKCSQFNVTEEMTDTDDTWETVIITSPSLTSSEAVSISLETIGTAGCSWFDDLNIDNAVYDIGADLFAGGTEISNVVDITDTSVPIQIKVLDTSKNPIQNSRVFIKKVSDDSVIVNTLTDSNGIVSSSINYTSDIDIYGWIRKSSASPYYKESSISGTITNTGYIITVTMIKDE